MDVNIMEMARENDHFRREVITGEHSQVVLMAIPPGGEIGEEVHPDVDQILLFVEGEGQAILEGETSGVGAGELVFVPAGTKHNFRNNGEGSLRLVTVYSPPEHPPGTAHRTKEEADA
jgi:mannose-6-phosphate isomerase-like protein (cupin superfamily)